MSGEVVTEDAAHWRRLAALLPPHATQEVLDCWDVGEQEAGLRLIISGLLGHGVPIGAVVRAEIAVMTETWGVREALAPDLARCVAGPGDEASPLRLTEAADAAPLPGPAVAAGGALEGLLVIPWITCLRRSRVLARAHRREPWGGLSYLAAHYVLFTPDEPEDTVLFGPHAAWDALTALRRSGGETPVLDRGDER